MLRLLFLLLFFPHLLPAQKLPSIQEKVKDFQKHDGFFPFYWDEQSGKIFLQIDETEKEFLYVTSLPAGIGSNDIGLDRGLLGDSRIVNFIRTGPKVLLVEPNYNFRAVTDDIKEKQAVEESFAQSTLWGFSVEAQTGNAVLVDATDFFMRDAMKIANQLRRGKQGNYSPDKTRSVMYLPRTKNFPLNSEWEASITLVNNDGETGRFLQSVTPSSEAITVRMHHSFVQLPDDGYQPREYDPRSGFIPVSFFDYSTPVSEPIIKRFIMRHRLQKKDPSAAMSEAVEPIVYYLDNGTPEPIRSALLEGGQWWNQAFEAAGYKNAFQLKILPDDADPMDVRYNVINWVHRSTRGWSYGNAVVDPRTGEIIKGHVSLGSLRVRQDYLIAQGLLAPFENGKPADDKMLKMALERLKQLSAHEIGHTIGLMHNYAASVSDRASVMDYPHPFVKLNANGQIDLSAAYDNKIGEWDKAAITWGYQDFPDNVNEKSALNNLIKQQLDKGLQFISDRDARAPGGLHPQAHLWDNGKDAVWELKHVLQIRAKALENFGEDNILPGTSYALLEDILVPVYFYHRYQLEAVTKLVGGMNYTYAVKGDGQLITKPLAKDVQLSALNAIIEAIDPNALTLSPKITGLIPPRPAGYGGSAELFNKRTGLSFDGLAPAETAVNFAFSLLFHPERLNRLAQTVDQNGLGLNEMLQTLNAKTFKSTRKKGIEALIQMQTEQVLLAYLLSTSVNEDVSYAARGIIIQQLETIKNFLTSKNTKDGSLYAGHIMLALKRMETPEDIKTTVHQPIPPGDPIGCDWN